VASSGSATAASHRTASLPLLAWCLDFKAVVEDKHFLRGGCGGRKAVLRAEEGLESEKEEEEGREAREAVAAMVLLSTGAIIE
jgi:hypothetical protein